MVKSPNQKARNRIMMEMFNTGDGTEREVKRRCREFDPETYDPVAYGVAWKWLKRHGRIVITHEQQHRCEWTLSDSTRQEMQDRFDRLSTQREAS